MKSVETRRKLRVRKRDIAVIMLKNGAVPKRGHRYGPMTNRGICKAYGYDGFRPPHTLQAAVCDRLREMRKQEPPKVKVVNNSPKGKYEYKLTEAGLKYAEYIYENDRYNKLIL